MTETVTTKQGRNQGFSEQTASMHSALPNWEPYDLERRATMILDVPPSLAYDPWGEECLAWKKFRKSAHP